MSEGRLVFTFVGMVISAQAPAYAGRGASIAAKPSGTTALNIRSTAIVACCEQSPTITVHRFGYAECAEYRAIIPYYKLPARGSLIQITIKHFLRQIGNPPASFYGSAIQLPADHPIPRSIRPCDEPVETISLSAHYGLFVEGEPLIIRASTAGRQHWYSMAIANSDPFYIRPDSPRYIRLD